jgi:U1 small nuclear ribonucleoprotein
MSTPYDKLPGGLKQLFSPRPGLRFLPAHDVAPEDRRTARITGVAAYLPALEAKVVAAKQSEAKELEPGDEGYEPPPTESWLEKRDNAAVKNQEHRKWMLTDGVKDLYKPSEDPTITADPFRTLFIARLSFDTVKDDLIREFERFGPVDRVKIVYNKGPTESEMLAKGVDRNKIAKKKRSGASQGYGFVMFKREDDMKGKVTLPSTLFYANTLFL